MKLIPTQTDEKTLLAFGEEARALLLRRDFERLANRFGYALTHDRVPSTAIEADFLNAAASPFTALSGIHQSILINYFAPDNTGLFAEVECTVPVTDGEFVLLELLVIGKGREKHILVKA